MNWQPIETAPRDGTYIIIGGRSGYRTTPIRACVCCWHDDGPMSYWRTYDGDWFMYGGGDATCWMPLPENNGDYV